MMKKKSMTLLLAGTVLTAALTGCGASGSSNADASTSETGISYKVAIVQYVDDASLNQIVAAMQNELDKKSQDSSTLNGAFPGYGVNYVELGTATADMAVDVLANGNDPATMPVQTLDNGIATVNTETAAALGLDYSIFSGKCSSLVDIQTAVEFN